MTDPAPLTPTNNNSPLWVLIVGLVFLGLAVLFFMGLVVVSLFGLTVPGNSRFLVCSVLALTSSIGSGFLGGSAVASGQLHVPKLLDNPIRFGVTGGIAVFVVVLLLCSLLYGAPAPGIQAPAIIDVSTGPGEGGRKIAAISYKTEPLPAQHKLVAEVATDAQFKQLARPHYPVEKPDSGQIVLSLPKSEQVKYWVRLVVINPENQPAATGEAMPFDVTSP